MYFIHSRNFAKPNRINTKKFIPKYIKVKVLKKQK